VIETELNDCDIEPIHIPGSIQSHGFLLVINELFNIIYASENTIDYLGLNPCELLGKSTASISHLLGKTQGSEFIQMLIQTNYGQKGFDPHNPFIVSLSGKQWFLIIQQSPSGFMLDFEPERADLEVDLQQLLGRSLSLILATKILGDILVNAANQLKQIIQYDRVMVYKFHKDGHGEVVAEAKNENLEPWLGLHYPASDIPKQARELYKVNLTRIISDVNVPPSAILSISNTPLDLSVSTLRAVSPIHIQYLKNMGVVSSFSVSIMCGDELWGLIACHNYTSRFINYRQRESAKLLGQVLGSAIDLREQEANQFNEQYHQKTLDLITHSLFREPSLKEALFGGSLTLQNLIPSTGAVMLFENELYTTGNVPNNKFVKAFCSWLMVNMETEIFSTSCLSEHFPEAKGFSEIVSGALVCRLSRNLNEFIIWFRPEITTIVKWAGNPNKIYEQGSKKHTYISPRNSFETWLEHVEYTSAAWEASEIKCALQLRDEINYSISRKAMELRILNEKLMEAYSELDTFAHTISHDLKSPLTAVKGYAQLLAGDHTLHAINKVMIKNIENSATKMGIMIEEILGYSKVGQSKMDWKAINMQALLTEIKTEIIDGNSQKNIEILVLNTPDLVGDKTMISQIFTNLISNAVKYCATAQTSNVLINGEMQSDSILYTVKDNGIGIHPEDHESIFELFSRSSNAIAFQGSGVGLSIVKRIVHKHGGKIWLESEEGIGSCFYVQFAMINKNTSNE
jgi:chemotaxis family two-component system sensor kinase Cph1